MVGTASVEDDEIPDVGTVGEDCRPQGCRQHIDGTALRKLGDQGRREDDVPQKARLHNERRHVLVYLKHREESLLRNLDRPDLLHALLAFLLLLEKLALA